MLHFLMTEASWGGRSWGLGQVSGAERCGFGRSSEDELGFAPQL